MTTGQVRVAAERHALGRVEDRPELRVGVEEHVLLVDVLVDRIVGRPVHEEHVLVAEVALEALQPLPALGRAAAREQPRLELLAREPQRVARERVEPLVRLVEERVVVVARGSCPCTSRGSCPTSRRARGRSR